MVSDLVLVGAYGGHSVNMCFCRMLILIVFRLALHVHILIKIMVRKRVLLCKVYQRLKYKAPIVFICLASPSAQKRSLRY